MSGAYLISCPWCGEAMNRRPISAQMMHIIACGDKREVAALKEARQHISVLSSGAQMLTALDEWIAEKEGR